MSTDAVGVIVVRIAAMTNRARKLRMGVILDFDQKVFVTIVNTTSTMDMDSG